MSLQLELSREKALSLAQIRKLDIIISCHHDVIIRFFYVFIILLSNFNNFSQYDTLVVLSNGLVVRALDFQSRVPVFKTIAPSSTQPFILT